MKFCIVRNDNLKKSFSKSFNFEEIKKIDVLKNIFDLPFVGLNYYFNADFRIESQLDPSQYDCLIYLDQNTEFFRKKHNKLIIINGVEIQPWAWQGKDELLFDIPDNVDYFLNNFILESTIKKQIPFWYRYDTKFFKNILKNKNKNILIQKRTRLTDIEYEKIKDYRLFNENYSSVSYTDYFNNLADIKYCINLDDSVYKNAGQIIAECCLMDIICFARNNKLFSKLLLPNFCIVNTVDEAIEKIKILENDFELYKQILSEINLNTLKIDYTNKTFKI